MAGTGPIVGWVRPDSRDPNITLIRVWIEVDGTHADLPAEALTVVRFAKQQVAQVWPVQNQLLNGTGFQSKADRADPTIFIHPLMSSICYAVADIAVPTALIDGVKVEMVSIHTYSGPIPDVDKRPNSGLPPKWGIPMRTDELESPKSKTPLSTGGVAGKFALTPLSYKTGNSASEFNFALEITAPAATRALASPEIYSASRHSTQSTRLMPAYVLNNSADIESLLEPLQLDIKLGNKTAYSADPKTLSRQSRALRGYGQRILQLERKQLEDTGNGNLSFYAAGCRHPGLTGFETKRADSSLRMALEAIDINNPRFMLMLGDQIYADVRAGVIDTESPIEKLLSRYHEAFGDSQSFRKLARRLPMYMVMDDHEINDNWSAEQVLQSNLNAVLADNAKAAFTIFQYAHGPGFPVDLQNPTEQVQGFNYCVEHNDIPFLVLDTRSKRTRVPLRQMLHSSQWRWLEGWLLQQQKQKGTCPKFIISGTVVAPGLIENAGNPSPRGADTWQMCPDDRKRLLCFIAENAIENVVFLSNDYHCSAAAEISFTHSTVKAWAIVSPPLHAPMPFANVQVSEVCSQERIPLARGAARVRSTAWDGEGWLNCKVSRAPLNRFRLNLTFNLRRLDEQDWKPETFPARVWRM